MGEKKVEGPPPAKQVLLMYVILGTILSFASGRTPGTHAEFSEVCGTMCVVCSFFLWYSVFDVMTVGATRASANYWKKSDDAPELVTLAFRAQMNQVEQMTSFALSSLLFSFAVNGYVGACLSLLWVVLRALYAHNYRGMVGISWEEKMQKVGKFTIPCYFLINGMNAGVVVHVFRIFAVKTFSK